MIFLFELFYSVALTLAHVCTRTPSPHQHHRQHHCLWQMSTIDPCNSLNISYLLFKCLASILEHKKNTLNNLDNDREKDSEPSWHRNYILSAKVASENKACKPRSLRIDFISLELLQAMSPSYPRRKWAFAFCSSMGRKLDMFVSLVLIISNNSYPEIIHWPWGLEERWLTYHLF